ncbi:hypothetical protein [Flavobacterium sp.]|uniref:hypothetical protein n=1 Tax=Flavobacterium sp. TaxID=239 RepID=UPI003D145356
MKSILAVCFSLMFLSFQNFSELREKYHQASKSKGNAEKFYEYVQKMNSESAVIIAYKGAGTLLVSRFATNKEKRKEQFQSGVKMVEQAVAKETNNVEIRLVRLSIQENTPKFLKYKANIEEDKKVIMQNFNRQNAGLKDYIQKYVAQSKVFTEVEKAKLN